MIVPGILEKSNAKIAEKIELIACATHLVHIDIIDGLLFEKSTKTETDISFLEDIKALVSFEIHLMVQDPCNYLKKNTVAVKDLVTKIVSQVEAESVEEFILQAGDYGSEVGLSLDIKTPNSVLENLVEKYQGKIDYVQFMAINTGRSGQKFNPKVINKIADFRSKFPNMAIQVDGSCTKDTIPQLLTAGATNFAVNSAIFKNEDPIKAKKELDELLR